MSFSNSTEELEWPVDKIDRSQAVLMVIGMVMPFSALVIGGIIVFLSWSQFEWVLDILVGIILVFLSGCLAAALVIPQILRGSKVRQWQPSLDPEDQPVDFADRIISACLSSKIVQLAILDGAANACFICNLGTPSYYLLVGGGVALLAMFFQFPFPGWLDHQFRNVWSELTGKTVL